MAVKKLAPEELAQEIVNIANKKRMTKLPNDLINQLVVELTLYTKVDTSIAEVSYVPGW